MAGGWQVGPLLRSWRGHRVASLLVAVQLAVGLAIAIIAVQIGAYMNQDRRASTGLAEEELSVVEWQDGGGLMPAAVERRRARRAALLATPGVVAATSVETPLLGTFERGPDELAASPAHPGARVPAFELTGGAGLASVLGTRLTEGRDFVASDLTADETAAIVSRGLAEELFPGRSAVGQRFVSRSHGPSVVVGVGLEVRPTIFLMATDVQAVLYAREAAPAARTLFLVRHGVGDGEAVRAHVRAAQAPGPDAFLEVRAAGHVRASIRRSLRSALVIVGLMVTTILVVVLIGSVALTAYLVSQRTREIGLRRALGATRADVVRHFVLGNAILTLAGSLLGLGLVAAMLPPMLASQIGFEVSWPLLAATVAFVWVLNFLATLVPARRAAAVPPSVAAQA